MRDLIWVRIFIASLALLGESALASDNNSSNQDNTSYVNLVVEVSNHSTDSDSDNHLIIVNYQLVNSNLYHIDSYWLFGFNNIPVQTKYLLSFPRAPPVKLI